MSKVIKATDAERAEYAKSGPVYPLYGFIKHDGHRCAVEDLHGSWSAPDPVYEVMAPKGMHFIHSYCHSLLATSLRDVAQRLGGEKLVRCDCH
jgi:hypothetical protein